MTSRIVMVLTSSRVADSDKLGMRCRGRLTIWPRPPEDFSDFSFQVGAAVVAWLSDGWWEGVVVDFDVYGSGHLQVFFPGENRLLEIPRRNVRISRDWIDNKWVEVKGKKDIKSFISSSLNDVSKCSIKEPGNCENQMAPKLVAPEDKKMTSTSEHLAEKQATDVLKPKDIQSLISSSLNDVSKCSIKEPGNCENQMAPKLVAPEDKKMASTSEHLADKQATDVLTLKKRWSNDFLAGK
ncbi:hypothetical protein CQW23_35521 [Capsicum baccatum]|uniref:Agenet domain-containing protein n=1 Tax=Capsicum baccatum TaxID=33114 RepID=A0A2G2UVR9_CAPBA|nr:hypothetical protein CQW23_35521 [Capsicum baccatum]